LNKNEGYAHIFLENAGIKRGCIVYNYGYTE